MRRTVAFTTALALTTMLWAPTSLAAGDEITEPPEPPQEFCLHPIGAIICIGLVILAADGCGNGFGCSGETPRGGGSNPPDSSGGGHQGDGDGDQSGGGGDDED